MKTPEIIRGILAALRHDSPLRRYKVSPRCRPPVFRRQLLADVIQSLKQETP